MALNDQSTDQALLDAEHELWTTSFSYIKSMAVKAALDLGLADAIDHHGGAATLPQIVDKVKVHPSKVPCLRRLMRVLTVSGVFSIQQRQNVVPPAIAKGNGAATANGNGAATSNGNGVATANGNSTTTTNGTGVATSNGNSTTTTNGNGAATTNCTDTAVEPLYALTPVSRLLVGSRNLVSMMSMILDPTFVTPFLGIGAWFEHALPDPCIFRQQHGVALWKMAEKDPAFDALINDAMVSDSSFIMEIAIRECGEVFQGVTSLMDVAGGLGAASQVISKAFPGMECTVVDLGHVVAKAPTGTAVKYVVGDMFESVPPADAVFIKWVLHDWGHEDCVKILKNCKKSIPSREHGGKVVIMDIVVGAGPSGLKHKELHVMFDLYMTIVDGIERDEQEWKNIFLEAGYSGYKIIPVLGFRSIIEVYP